MKIAFVYDRVNKWGGAERVLLALHEIWPEAPLYTSVYNPETAPWAKDFKVFPSFLQKISYFKKKHESIPFLMPFAFENFDFNEYNVVISVSSEAAKGIITKPRTLHLCYCLTPTRYLWSGYDEYFQNKLIKLITKPLVNYLRSWDTVAAQRPDYYLTTCQTVQARIKKYYGRESQVVYPPIDVQKFQIPKSKFQINSKYFLVVSRLVKYKKVDLVIEAFNELGWNLKIVGVGRELANLKRKAKNNIEFLGQLTDEELLPYYQNCRSVIFPQEEDFGLVPLETQACGKPVIAFGSGGARETILEGKTGLFFTEQSSECLSEVLKNFTQVTFTAEACRKQAEKFSKEKFKKNFYETCSNLWWRWKENVAAQSRKTPQALPAFNKWQITI